MTSLTANYSIKLLPKLAAARYNAGLDYRKILKYILYFPSRFNQSGFARCAVAVSSEHREIAGNLKYSYPWLFSSQGRARMRQSRVDTSIGWVPRSWINTG